MRPGGHGVIGLVAIDVDGTLLDSRHEVSAATAAAIDRVRRAGVEVVLTTSRPPRALWPVLERLALVEPGGVHRVPGSPDRPLQRLG